MLYIKEKEQIGIIIKNILFQQHKFQMDYKGFELKYYITTQETPESRNDMVFSAINLSKIGITPYVSNFIKSYFGKLSDYTNNFHDDLSDAVQSSREYVFATNILQTLIYNPVLLLLIWAYRLIVNDANLVTGSKIPDKSSLHHVSQLVTIRLNY